MALRAAEKGRIIRLLLESGRYVVPVDLVYGERELPHFTEAIVVV